MLPFTVRQGGRQLQKLTGQQRANIILRLASLLREKEEEILAANKTDIALAKDTLSPSLLARLRLSSTKLQTLADGISAIAEVSRRTEYTHIHIIMNYCIGGSYHFSINIMLHLILTTLARILFLQIYSSHDFFEAHFQIDTICEPNFLYTIPLGTC